MRHSCIYRTWQGQRLRGVFEHPQGAGRDDDNESHAVMRYYQYM